MRIYTNMAAILLFALHSAPVLAQMQSIMPPILSSGQNPVREIIAGTPGKTATSAGAGQSQQAAAAAGSEAEGDAGAQSQSATSVSLEGSGADDVTRTVFQDWVRECHDDVPVAESRCQIVHKVVSGQGSRQILVMALSIDSTSGRTNAQIAIPLGIVLGPGVQIVVGRDYQGDVQVDRCTQQGCLIEGRVTDDLLAAMRRQKEGAIVVFNTSGGRVRLPFSLMGFTDAYASISETAADANS